MLLDLFHLPVRMLMAFSIFVVKYVMQVLVLGFEGFCRPDMLRVSCLKLQGFEANSVDNEQRPLLFQNWEGSGDKAARQSEVAWMSPFAFVTWSPKSKQIQVSLQSICILLISNLLLPSCA